MNNDFELIPNRLDFKHKKTPNNTEINKLMNKLNFIDCYEYLNKIKYSSAYRHKIIKVLLPIYLGFNKSKRLLFIFGVQRSGTSVTFHNLSRLFGVKGYGEFSDLTALGDEKLRFSSYRRVKNIINKNLEPFIINKPLVESQVADIVLKNFDYSIGIWMYRDYRDVVNSFHKKFGESIGRHHIDFIINGDLNNWRSERVPEKFQKLAIDINKKGLTNHDCTSLYWYIRNSLYFEYQFYNISNLKLVSYEVFVQNPSHFITKICNLWGYTYKIDPTKLTFNTNSINRDTLPNIHPEIKELCQDLSIRLNKEFKNQGIFNTKH